MPRIARWFALLCVACFFIAEASAQTVTTNTIKPGKEKIVLALPKEQGWKRERIRNDERSVRTWLYRATRPDTLAAANVGPIKTTTIDRRYFPITARGTMMDKIESARMRDADARLEILHHQLIHARASIIYAVLPGKSEGSAMLVLAIEGPTAFHSVEIPIGNHPNFTETLQRWTEILAQSRVE